jgi:two-component system, chemotaxis family, sensor kinase Cph1
MLDNIFQARGFVPHGYCLSLRSDLIALHVVSDAIVALAYFMIPVTLLYFIRRNPHRLSFNWAIALFAAFILFCGTGHLIEIVTIWRPVYVLQGIEKAGTAVISIATALAIIPLVPRLLALTPPEVLEQANERLRGEVGARVAAEAELQRSLAELREALSDVEDFAHSASHDLQAPLRNITAFSQLVKKRCGGKLDREEREYLDYIEKGARQMHTLIADILALSRVGRDERPMESRPLDEAVDRAVESLASDIAACDAQVVRGPLPTLAADHGLLVQLFQNLIGNAIKFQPAGRKPRVGIAARREGADWVVSVRDNGIGLPPRDLDALFRPFYRGHAQDRYEGSGVGLALCRKIALYHGGDIRAVPAAEGAEFEVRLPVAQRPRTREANPPAAALARPRATPVDATV